MPIAHREDFDARSMRAAAKRAKDAGQARRLLALAAIYEGGSREKAAEMADDTDFEYLIVDSTIVRAHQHAAGGKKRGAEDQAIGRSRGGLRTKIHMAVGGLGCPVRFVLTVGQIGDSPQVPALIEGLPAEVVMADTAYDSDELRVAIAEKGTVAVIPNNPSRARKYRLDKHLYAQRHLVECCFSKLKRFRRVVFLRRDAPCEIWGPRAILRS
jgi:transposase